MAIKIIEIDPTLLKQSFQVDLDGVVYLFVLHYNHRMSRWIMSLSSAAGIQLKTGIPILLGVPFFSQFVDTDLPLGLLFAVNPNSPSQEAGEDDLGVNVLMAYDEAA